MIGYGLQPVSGVQPYLRDTMFAQENLGFPQENP